MTVGMRIVLGLFATRPYIIDSVLPAHCSCIASGFIHGGKIFCSQ